MRRILLATAILATAFVTAPASARDYPYCLQSRDYGYPGSCFYTTYQQCEATASGTGAVCGINPMVAFKSQQQQQRPGRYAY